MCSILRHVQIFLKSRLIFQMACTFKVVVSFFFYFQKYSVLLNQGYTRLFDFKGLLQLRICGVSPESAAAALLQP